jgi:hypothetical protein
MDRKSWRPTEFAERHSVSPSFVYGEIKAGRLRARKPAGGVTIITSEDERAWLDAMPLMGESSPDNSEAA